MTTTTADRASVTLALPLDLIVERHWYLRLTWQAAEARGLEVRISQALDVSTGSQRAWAPGPICALVRPNDETRIVDEANAPDATVLLAGRSLLTAVIRASTPTEKPHAKTQHEVRHG